MIFWTAAKVICLNLERLGLVSGAVLERVIPQEPEVRGWLSDLRESGVARSHASREQARL